MKLGPAGYSLMGAGLLMSALCGLAMCSVNARFHWDRKLAGKQPWSPVRIMCNSAIACAVFSFFRALASVGAVLLFFLRSWVKIPQIALLVTVAISAVLYLGEVIPAGLSVNRGWDTVNLTSVDSDNFGFVLTEHRSDLYRKRDWLSWSVNFDWRQELYNKDNDAPKPGSWPNRVEGYAMPYGAYFNAYGEFEAYGSPSAVPCLIDLDNSTWPEPNQDGFYDSCDNFTVLTVECVGGWNEKNFNSAISEACKKENTTIANIRKMSEALTGTEWFDTLRKHQDLYNEVNRPAYFASANMILIVFETVSFLLTVIGLVFQLVFSSELGSP